MPKGLAGRGKEWFSSAKPDRLVGTEAAARVSCGEPITPFRTANSPTETIRIWPHRIRLRLPSPVRFPAKRGAECRGFSEPTARRRSQGDWLAEGAVSSEPVSGRKFPANRENNREFCKIGADRRLSRPKSPLYRNGLEANSLRDLNREFSEP